MHIGVNTLSIIPGRTGGGETYLLGLLGGLAKVDGVNRYTVFTTPRNNDLFALALPKFECVPAPVPGRLRAARVLYEHWRLPALVRRCGIDVLFSPGNAAVPVQGCAQVVAIQSILYHLAPRETGKLRRQYFKRIVPWSVRRADMTIAVSHDAKRVLHSLVDVSDERVRVVHEAAAPLFAPPSEEAIDAMLRRHDLARGYLLFVSTLKPYKNADKFIRACGRLKDRHGIEPAGVIVGYDPLGMTSELRALAESAGVGDNIRFLGGIAHGDLPCLYALSLIHI